MPLTASILVRPAVTFARKINPFGMSEFISHKVQIASIDGRSGQQANHLMQSYASFCDTILITFTEMPIHIRIDQTENNRLVSYQCLVMAFTIRNSLFVFSPIGHFPEHTGRFPVFILAFLDYLNPIIRNIHSHTVIETISSVIKRSSQSWHT